uniref:Immunoglobulin V-set domain-containing protein n=1 Tax=Hucho hucho TaxID=62062 RepID=A0A4W5K4I0_9TELE
SEFIYTYVLLLTCLAVFLEAIPSSPEMKNPGEPLSLSCKGSGFTFSSYNMAWIHQPAAGKGLEWIIYFHSDTHKRNAPVVRGRFTASKDSTNLYLPVEVRGLTMVHYVFHIYPTPPFKMITKRWSLSFQIANVVSSSSGDDPAVSLTLLYIPSPFTSMQTWFSPYLNRICLSVLVRPSVSWRAEKSSAHQFSFNSWQLPPVSLWVWRKDTTKNIASSIKRISTQLLEFKYICMCNMLLFCVFHVFFINPLLYQVS